MAAAGDTVELVRAMHKCECGPRSVAFLGLHERSGWARNPKISATELTRFEHEVLSFVLRHPTVLDRLNVINVVGAELAGRLPQLLEAMVQDSRC